MTQAAPGHHSALQDNLMSLGNGHQPWESLELKVIFLMMGLVWEGGDGLNGMPMGELVGLVRELVWEMRGFREELREVKKVVEKGLRNVAKASHLWHRTPIVDALNYMEWWVGFQQEEIEEEYQELWREDLMYWEYLKKKQVDKEKLDEFITTSFKDYKLEEGKEERGDGLEEWVPEVDLEE